MWPKILMNVVVWAGSLFGTLAFGYLSLHLIAGYFMVPLGDAFMYTMTAIAVAWAVIYALTVDVDNQ